MELIYRDEYIEINKLQNNWAHVYWVNHDAGRLSKSFIKMLKDFENKIKEYKCLGWFCNSEFEHKTMHKIIEKFGAERYFVDDAQQLFWFRKVIN